MLFSLWRLSRRPIGKLAAPTEIVIHLRAAADGELTISEGISKPGDYVVLRAEMPLIVVISNCPQDNNPAAGFAPTPVEVVVSRAE
jgi:uncharacterized protein YcgI (DUF1989 family)